MKTLFTLLGVSGVVLVLFSGCGPNAPGGVGGGVGATCHVLEHLDCPAELAAAKDACAAEHGTVHPDPIVCEDDVWPDGNCRALDVDTSCAAVVGRVWCCNENTDASCVLFDDAACNGPSATDLAGRCVVAFGELYDVPYTCAPEDGPLGCKRLSTHSPGLSVECGQGALDVWCCGS